MASFTTNEAQPWLITKIPKGDAGSNPAPVTIKYMRDRAEVARWAHTPEAVVEHFPLSQQKVKVTSNYIR